MRYLGLIITGITFSGVLEAQSTFSQVYTIFQTNCATGCHSGGNPSAQLDLGGTEQEVYNELINVDPLNPAALAKGDKLVKPGHPNRSFLLRKCYDDLEPSEGNAMPSVQSLDDAEIALIENWILFGAPETGEVVDYAVIQDYYNGEGLTEVVEVMEKPDPSEGFQIHLGSIYLEPQTEVEYFIKQDLGLSSDIEVTGLDVDINSSSHHFLLYKFDEGTAGNYSDGLRLLGTEASDNDVTLVSAWQFDNEITLPSGTAYFWEAGTNVDLNYHIVNYSLDSILKAELYCNVYTQESGIAEKEMYSDLVLYPPMSFYLPANGQDHVFSDEVYEPGSNVQLNVWMLSSHTHKYGTDYDIYKRNPDGTKGEQLYEGFYDVDYNFNQGYYDWEHPAIAYFEPFEPILYSEGFIHEAKFNNYGDDPVYFNVTTEDEMMLFFIQYTADILETTNEIDRTSSFLVYPNPLKHSNEIFFEYSVHEKALIELLDISGRTLYKEENYLSEGANKIDLPELENGIYKLKISGSKNVSVSSLIIER